MRVANTGAGRAVDKCVMSTGATLMRAGADLGRCSKSLGIKTSRLLTTLRVKAAEAADTFRARGAMKKLMGCRGAGKVVENTLLLPIASGDVSLMTMRTMTAGDEDGGAGRRAQTAIDFHEGRPFPEKAALI